MVKKRIKVPLAEIKIDSQLHRAVKNTLNSGKYILGENTENFENKFAKFCGAKYGSCISSGTAAIFLALSSLGVKKHDEIIIPSLSFIATATPILMLGATPKFVDADSRNYTIDYNMIEKKITKKTKGIIPVHLYGHPSDMDKIKKIARDYSLFILEDAAQAHGAKYKGKSVGSLGDAACFSFYPSKNLTVCGDGGMVVSNNKELIQKVKILRNHGRTEKYLHHVLGFNLRFNEIQAAIGLQMLKKLKNRNSIRRKIARKYSRELVGDFIKPYEEEWGKHVYHMYTIRTKSRNKLQKFLKKRGISTGIHYPIPIHKQPVYKKFNKIKLPITEEIAATTLSIPMFPTISNKQQDFVIKMINRFFKNFH